MTMKTDRERIEELERRVEELEKRVIPLPYFPPGMNPRDPVYGDQTDQPPSFIVTCGGAPVFAELKFGHTVAAPIASVG